MSYSLFVQLVEFASDGSEVGALASDSGAMLWREGGPAKPLSCYRQLIGSGPSGGSDTRASVKGCQPS